MSRSRKMIVALAAAMLGVLAKRVDCAGKRTRTRSGGYAALALSMGALLGLSAGVAQAEVPKLVPSGKFTSEGGPLGVAVDQPSGDVFATGFIELARGFAPGHSEKFDASGKLLAPPSPFAEAFDTGAAVNPTNGDLYAENDLSHEIDTYDPNTGALLSAFVVPSNFSSFGQLLENIAQIATDSAGNVYVPNALESNVSEYDPATCTAPPEPCVPSKTFKGSGAHELSRPTGVAVDPSGDVWVADDGNSRVEEFDPNGGFLSEFKSEGVQALALDAHSDILAIVTNSADSCGSQHPPCGHLVEYSSTGAQLADLGAGAFGPHGEKNEQPLGSRALDMVAVDQASGRVYVSDQLENAVWVFQPPAAPTLGRESAAEVGDAEARLGALVNPEGLGTSYRFEYDTREYAAGEGSHGVSVPFPEGSAGQAFSSRAVWAAAKGLTAGTTYHYRAVVTNGLGTVVGPDETFTTQTAAQRACPNEQLRGGFSAALPDCRAYELVTPVGRTSFQPDTLSVNQQTSFLGGGFVGNLAATDGDRMSYLAAEVAPGSTSAGLEYVATRSASGWSSQDVIPLQRYNADRCTQHYEHTIGVLAYSADLSKTVLFDGSPFEEAQLFCDWDVEVVPGEPMGVANVLLRDNSTATYRLIDLPPSGVQPTDARLVAASTDERRIVFEELAKLTPDALNGAMNTYEWSEGVVRLAFVLPSGAPAVGGSLAGISADGSEVFFTANGKLYMRLNGERTLQLDQARGGPGPGGAGSLAAVTADGAHVFFTADASAGLTGDTVPGSGANLYRFDVSMGVLSDLTPAEHAGVGGATVSEDGSYLYFSSRDVLPGSQANQLGETAQSGQPNFYVDHGGTISFIVHEPRARWTPPGTGELVEGGWQISANGAYLAFTSTGSLTGYDNANVSTSEPEPEIYLYSAASNRFVCASCNPSGERPTAEGAFIGGGLALENEKGRSTSPVPRYVSDNGQVFFQGEEALLPRDTNGQRDVYEYDHVSGLHLISSGTSSNPSTLLDTSASGHDVFFLGRQALVPQDSGGEANRIYDARVEGGFPETAVLPACDTADACRSAPESQPSVFGEPASQTFSGAGNLPPPPVAANATPKPKAKPKQCRKGYAKKKRKCLRVKKARRARSTNRKGRR